ncbi:DUF4192 domain-containing protein [Streptomyces montanisoli]|uniref:DUF4192 domain-containing protein n=1 Tax=Streptomyces montanisoli TaxID=2798581 RepID=A0A940MD73_9ACTN|nr:DUF4192 domain-containing protein [Streptomyces montanisoli]MBP0459124.1 DUF4192 domain-containing protein [Streptomyces montanisoli]
MSNHHDTPRPADEQAVTLRGPAELADALPYILGFRPTDSVVLVTLHGERARFGGRLRLGIPGSPREWPAVADQLAAYAVEAAQGRGSRPDGILVFLYQDPGGAGEPGETGREVMERLRPLAQRLRTACGALDVPVVEALCVSGGRLWSYCCPDPRCCPPEGTETVLPGTSVMAAAAAYAGLRVRGSLKDLERRILPPGPEGTAAQARAFDAVGAAIVPQILGGGRAEIATKTLGLARDLVRRLDEAKGAPPTTPDAEAAADAVDDGLIRDEEAAAVVLGLQDRETRDQAAGWTEEGGSPSALRLWRALARRCGGIYVEYAAAPLVLAGWAAWATGDEPSARVALGRALSVDPGCHLAHLLQEACNQGLDLRAVRACFGAEPAEPAEPAAREPEGRRGVRAARRVVRRARPRVPRQPGGVKALPTAVARPGEIR